MYQNAISAQMSEIKLPHTHCAVQGCKTSVYNKGVGITLHQLPSNSVTRSKWLSVLKDRCLTLDWSKNKICSKHFENRYFDSSRRLKDDAIPSIFPMSNQNFKAGSSYTARTRMDRLLNGVTQAELIEDIKGTMCLIKVPGNFSDCVDDDLQCVPGTPVEAQLWLLIKKQEHLITRLTQAAIQNKKHVEVLQKNIDESRSAKKTIEQSVESYKYIMKCLQEKQATLEEQIELLTAVESR